jgi:hypothetical protein
VASGTLRLFIEHDQEPWSPEFAGHLRVSSLQTGVFAGPVGSAIGQHRFREGIIVREAQGNETDGLWDGLVVRLEKEAQNGDSWHLDQFEFARFPGD